MSTLIVEVCAVDSIAAHPNADSLELCIIKGWQCVIPINTYKPGDLVTYVPIDSLVPMELAERWGIAKYLSVSTEEPEMGRVRCAKLRGEPSFGVAIACEDNTWVAGTDVCGHYGIKKYIPPVKVSSGDSDVPHPLLVEYTEIENLRNFPYVFEDGETVSVTEKIHGANARIAMIENKPMAGSMRVRRKMPEDMSGNVSTYWKPFQLSGVRSLLEFLAAEHKQVIIFGEVFGSKIQNLNYEQKGDGGFSAFDLMLDGKYVSNDVFETLCADFQVQTVPKLYEGPYSLAKIVELSKGNTTIGGEHIREGVVVKPVIGRTHPKVGRVCMKYINDVYLLSKSVSDSNDV